MKEAVWLVFVFVFLVVLMLDARASDAQYSRTLGYAWDAPTAREDGSDLSESELFGYELDLNGTIHSTDKKEIDIIISSLGEHCAKVRAIDTDGQVSQWSESLCTIVKAAPQRLIIRFSGGINGG